MVPTEDSRVHEHMEMSLVALATGHAIYTAREHLVKWLRARRPDAGLINPAPAGDA